MRLRLTQFVALARLTTLEIVRQPVCLMLTVACVFVMALAPLQAFNFGEEGKFARDSALAIHLVLGMALGAYAACTALSREMRNGTAAAVLAKPVDKSLFFLAKFAGVASVIILFSICAILASLLSEKASPKLYRTDWLALGILFAAPVAACLAGAAANFYTRRQYAPTALRLLLLFLVMGLTLSRTLYDPSSSYRDVEGRVLFADTSVQWRIIPAGLLVTMALVVLAAVALALSVRFNTAAVLAMCSILLFMGLTSEYFFAPSSPAAVMALHILPDWQHFWLADALTAGGVISWSYVATAGMYAFFCAAAALGAGVLLFQYREVSA